MRCKHFVLLSLVVLLFLLTSIASGSARIVSHPYLRFFQNSSYSNYYQHNTLETQTGLFANNDPVNQVDPDGRFGKGAFTGDRSNFASNVGATLAQSFPAGPMVQNYVNNLRTVGNPSQAAGRTLWGNPQENALLAWKFHREERKKKL
jgi:hypothetical protein